MRRGARDRRQEMEAVEVQQGGRPDSFDGNHSNALVSWLLLDHSKDIESMHADDMQHLMNWTAMGHLAWCVFPIPLNGA